jgi:hypothetical protein
MARLKCHGRELLRLEREINTPDGELTTWERITKVYMSDGKVMSKLDVRFKPSTFEPHGRNYSYGWKIAGTKKAEVTMQAYEEMVKRQIAIITKPDYNGKWVIVNGGPAPVVISQARILRAVESGDSIGFCKACGEETEGVEPDARGYRCESCGMHEVYGAEEMLVAG